MKKILLGISACLLGLQAAADLTVKTIASGETLEVFGTKADDPDNHENMVLDLQAGGTLQLSRKSQECFNLWASLVCTNGPAVVEFSEGVTEFQSKCNFIVRAPGSLTIKRRDCPNFWFGSANAVTASAPQYDFSGLADILNADGSRATPTFFHFNNSATLCGLPPPHIRLGAATAISVGLWGENLFPGETVDFGPDSGFQANVLVLSPKVFSAGQTVKLARNRQLGFCPREVADFATTLSRTWSHPAAGPAVYDFGIEAEESTRVYASARVDVEFRGKLVGAAGLCAERTGADWPAMTFACTGDLTEWTGLARVYANERLCLNAASVSSALVAGGGELAFDAHQTAVSVATAEGTVDASGASMPKIVAGAGQMVSLVDVNGTLALCGDATSAADAIDVAGSASGAHVVDDGTAAVTFAGQAEPANCLTLPASDDTVRHWLLPSAAGLVSAPGDAVKPPSATNWYVVKGDVTVDTLPLGIGLRRAEGDTGTVRVLAAVGASSVVGVHSGDSVTLETAAYDWRAKALLWLDPSQEGTFAWVRSQDNDTSSILTGSYGGETCQTFRGLLDPRAASGLGLRAWQTRSWMFYDTKGYESLASVHPMRATKNAPAEGLAYMAFGAAGGSRRIQFVDWTEGMTGVSSFKAGFSNVMAKFVVMVFGSQDGGGSAIFGSDNYFKRTGKTLADPMMNRTVDVWTNGVKVANSKTALFSGSWDVFSVDTSGCGGITLLGGNATSDAGGHCLGEMIFFSEVLSDVERRDVERYLAKKWGLADKYAGEANVGLANLAGSGSVSVAAGSRAQLEGAFAGTLTLADGAEVSLAEGQKPFVEDEVAALNPSFWIDPSLGREVIAYATGATTWANVNTIVQRDPAKRAINGENYYLTSQGGSRMPATVEKAAYFGPSYTWVDYNGTNETSNTQGNTLRITKNASYTSGSTSTLDTQMGFIVQDSARGGGTPFLDTVLGSGTVKARMTDRPKTEIYLSQTSDILKKSPVYLNGTAVNYWDGFTGAPEVFTFTATEPVPVGFFAYLGNSENGRQQGEEQGEILLFAEKLADEPRSRVEAYLMKKWFGFMPSGFTDYSAATLDGAGTFAAPNAAVAPKLAPTFAGTYAIGGETATFDMAVQADGTVDGALVAPNATLALPPAVTLNVSSAGKLSGDLVLVQAADIGSTTFTLAGAAQANAALLVRDNTVLLHVNGGTVIIFR